MKQLGVAIVYVVFARVSLAFFSPTGVVGLFWPASGWALAVVLLGGRRYAWGVFLGGIISVTMSRQPLWVAILVAGGSALEALVCAWLLTRAKAFDLGFKSMRDYQALLIQAGLVGCSVSALIGNTALTTAQILPADGYLVNLTNWWMADALGIALLTPLILTWRTHPEQWANPKYWGETILVLGLCSLVGQTIFLDWLPDSLGRVANQGYWMYLFTTWAAIRLGLHIVTVVLCLIAVQVMTSLHFQAGFFVHGFPETQLLDSWFYLLVLSLVSMSLAIYIANRRRAEADLRIAAIAFECQEGMLVTDPNHVILRTNQSFTRIMGYSQQEVVGKSTSLMRSDRHPADFYEAIWESARLTGTSANEVWHRRKSGEVFPQWLTSTAVKNEHGEITHYVVTHTDITYQKEQEAKRLADEASHRDALVREVHHRIKNNLQGITGMLRQIAQERPEAAEPINQAIAQVRSIAVIHGLQGRANVGMVRLCELTRAIAADVESVWRAPIKVDIPSVWVPGIVAESEAVPMALVLNELIINAVKHGGKARGSVEINLRKGSRPDVIQVIITNGGQWRVNTDRRGISLHVGLQLVDTLLPREGSHLMREQQGNRVVTRLEVEPPVITLETKENT
jgi:PAS domain S-box-containing protein